MSRPSYEGEGWLYATDAAQPLLQAALNGASGEELERLADAYREEQRLHRMASVLHAFGKAMLRLSSAAAARDGKHAYLLLRCRPTELPRKLSKKLRALGVGTYSECRGSYNPYRTVQIPVTHEALARETVDTLGLVERGAHKVELRFTGPMSAAPGAYGSADSIDAALDKWRKVVGL